MSERSTARCHCGAVQISFVMVDGLGSLHRCDCSMCKRKYPGAVSGLIDDLCIEAGADMLGLYQFGSMTARHQFCKICGVHVFHQRRSNPEEIGVNVACVDGLDARIASTALWVDGVDHPNDA
ncbi:MAG: GFA family protein [Pseudomonadota bacterium]